MRTQGEGVKTGQLLGTSFIDGPLPLLALYVNTTGSFTASAQLPHVVIMVINFWWEMVVVTAHRLAISRSRKLS